MKLAGEGGFEPPNGGSKGRFLTAWRLPSVVDAKLLKRNGIAVIPDYFLRVLRFSA